MMLDIFLGNQKIGNIQWNIENTSEGRTLSINWISVLEPFRGKQYGSLLLISALALSSLRCGTVQLDDCSDRSLQRDNIYFKLGFRIPSQQNMEQMVLAINKEYQGYQYPDQLHPTPVESHRSLTDFLMQLKDKLPNNFEQLIYQLDGKDITNGMIRRFKVLQYIPSRLHKYGTSTKLVSRLKQIAKYLKKWD